MKAAIKFRLSALLFLLPVVLFAQKDSIRLVCPFEHGSGREPKEAFTWDPPDQKVIMISNIDSNIRSCINGEVVKIEGNGAGEYEVVIFGKGYYFWYNNVAKPAIQVRQLVTAGQPIGVYKLGEELEFRMYRELKKDEPIMMDPRNWLECKLAKEE